MPIIRKDSDIINLKSRKHQDVVKVIDIFVKAQTAVHILRAVEPTLRLGQHVDQFLDKIDGQSIPKCAFLNTSQDYKCINLASKKQIGEAVVAIESFG